jgi:hypothetical protein
MPTPTSRRNNAPVNPPRQPSLVPEPLICVAIALGVMGLIFMGFSFFGIFAEGDAGRTLARLFAASLIISGFLLFLLGFGLLGEVRGKNSYYAVPTLLGAIIGVSAAALFVSGTGKLVMVPFALAILAIRPFRTAFTRGKGRRQ